MAITGLSVKVVLAGRHNAELRKQSEEQAIRFRELQGNVQRSQELMHQQLLDDWVKLNRNYPVPEYLAPYINTVYEDREEHARQRRRVNIAIVGGAGKGKSSLTKKILHCFSPSEADSAAGVAQPVSQPQGRGTHKPTPYELPGHNGATIWDLPGVGPATQPGRTYLRDMGLKYFDMVILVTGDRWLEDDKATYDAIVCAGLCRRIVRTKTDLAVESGEEDFGWPQEKSLQEMREAFHREANLQGSDREKVHFVTSRDKFWTGQHGGEPFGSIECLCDEIHTIMHNLGASLA